MKSFYSVLAACVLATSAFAGFEYRQLLSGLEIRPENLGLNSLGSGGNLTGRLQTGGDFATWITSKKTQEANGWSSIGIEFKNSKATLPTGFRMEVALSRPLSVNIEPRINKVPGKGFWFTEWLGRRSVSLPAGRQTLEFTWSDLNVKVADWSRVNAVSLAVSEPARIQIFSFGLLYQESLPPDATNIVNWFDSNMDASNPVARPFHKMGGVFSVKATTGLTSRLEDTTVAGNNVLTWKVDGLPGTKGWAVYGFGFKTPIDPPIRGVRFEVILSEKTELGLNVCKGFTANKGFYGTKKSGQAKKVVLPAGRQFIDFNWSDFSVPEAELDFINAVEFSAGEAGVEMTILKVDMIFPDAEKAAAYRMTRDRKLEQLQKTMLEALEARGVSWSSALKEMTPQEVEPYIWTGIMLSAQREQLSYFKTLYNPTEADRLLAKNAALIAAGKQKKLAGLQEKSETMQKSIDTYIDAAIATLPLEKRRFTYDEKTKFFRYPDGTPYRMFGPHLFRALYAPGRNSWRPWDLRYLAGLGFNGIRLHVNWSQLEPDRGKFDPVFLDMLKKIVREAERYGFGISVDLHWPYPDWFNQGKAGFGKNGNPGLNNSYHWPDALIDSWKRLGAEFADLPNIVAFEVPTNETPFGGDPAGLQAWPYLMMRWNQFLKLEYNTRENLQAVWGAAADSADRYGLAADENWDDNSIRPLGFQDDASPDQAYEFNPRFYDHLRFAAMMQKEVSGGIMAVLRESIPGAKGMFQRTIGDSWDRCPVPVDYHSILTSVGENVLPGTHYNMGGIHARKAATLTQGSYDSEQQMEGLYHAVKRHVELGLGFCPFTFFYNGDGEGMLLADDDSHLKPQVAYLPKMADWIRTYWPVKKKGTPVAVITNARLEASNGAKLGDLIEQLEARGCRVGVFETLRVVDEPSLLEEYAFVVTASDYIDLRLLDVLRNQFKGKILLNGRLDMDAYVRKQAAGLPAYLIKNKLLLKSGPVRVAGNLAGKLDLSGTWDFMYLGIQSQVPTAPPTEWKNLERLKVPGMWGETEITGSHQFRLGDGAYRRSVKIPANWKGRSLKLKLGAVDDLDWVFWNGKLIGHTGENMPNYWMVSREYAIPKDATNFGKVNELVVIVRNLRDDAGISRAPVEISGSASGLLELADGRKLMTVCGDMTSLIAPEQLVDDAELLARFRLPNSKKSSVALVRQGRFLWYFSDQEFNKSNPSDQYALDQALTPWK